MKHGNWSKTIYSGRQSYKTTVASGKGISKQNRYNYAILGG